MVNRKQFTGAAIAAGMLASQATAASTPWLSARQTQFDAWQSAHRDVEQQIAMLKANTTELLANHRERKSAIAEARRQSLASASAALSGEERSRLKTLVDQASQQSRAGDCSGAMELFKRALAIDPANVAANLGMGQCLRDSDPRSAADYLTRAIDSPANDVPSRQAKLGAMMALQLLPPPTDPDIGDPPAIFRVEGAPQEVWDAPQAPVMVIIPGGEYTMGAPPDEPYVQESERQHRVTIGYPLAVSKYNVTRGEFAAFARETGYNEKGCDIFTNGTFVWNPEANWENPGFEQSDEDAVACITWYDAKAYADWLSRKTGHRYRLPSEAEWEYAVRAGTTTMYYWGTEIGTGNANCDGCNEGAHEYKPTPGGKFPPNAFGLYDMVGNVWKWLEDCWNPTYDGAPRDGSAWLSGNCSLRGRRTGSWFNLEKARPDDPRAPGRLRSAGRFGSMPGLRISSFGFRVVREL